MRVARCPLCIVSVAFVAVLTDATTTSDKHFSGARALGQHKGLDGGWMHIPWLGTILIFCTVVAAISITIIALCGFGPSATKDDTSPNDRKTPSVVQTPTPKAQLRDSSAGNVNPRKNHFDVEEDAEPKMPKVLPDRRPSAQALSPQGGMFGHERVPSGPQDWAPPPANYPPTGYQQFPASSYPLVQHSEPPYADSQIPGRYPGTSPAPPLSMIGIKDAPSSINDFHNHVPAMNIGQPILAAASSQKSNHSQSNKSLHSDQQVLPPQYNENTWLPPNPAPYQTTQADWRETEDSPFGAAVVTENGGGRQDPVASWQAPKSFNASPAYPVRVDPVDLPPVSKPWVNANHSSPFGQAQVVSPEYYPGMNPSSDVPRRQQGSGLNASSTNPAYGNGYSQDGRAQSTGMKKIPFQTSSVWQDMARAKKGKSFKHGQRAIDEEEKMQTLYEDLPGHCKIPIEKIRLSEVDGELFVLGEGGFGKVLHGDFHKEECAIKVVFGGTTSDQINLLKEIHILHQIHTDHVVRFKGCCLCDEGMILAMQYCPGGNLAEALNQDDEYQWYNRGKNAMMTIASALVQLHSQRIAHLDLKSYNVLIDKDKSVKVADVGLGKIVKNIETLVKSTVNHSFFWAAPEQIEGKKLGLPADIWAFGTVLWEVCAAESATHRLVKPELKPDQAPQAIIELVAMCHEPDPSKRMNAEQLRDYLEVHCEDE